MILYVERLAEIAPTSWPLLLSLIGLVLFLGALFDWQWIYPHSASVERLFMSRWISPRLRIGFTGLVLIGCGILFTVYLMKYA